MYSGKWVVSPFTITWTAGRLKKDKMNITISDSEEYPSYLYILFYL